jgi:hypothetical protein
MPHRFASDDPPQGSSTLVRRWFLISGRVAAGRVALGAQTFTTVKNLEIKNNCITNHMAVI